MSRYLRKRVTAVVNATGWDRERAKVFVWATCREARKMTSVETELAPVVLKKKPTSTPPSPEVYRYACDDLR